MGKKAKKGKVLKEKRAVSTSPTISSHGKTVTEESDQVTAPAEHDIISCPHISKCLNLCNVLEKLGSSEPLKCVYCRDATIDRRGNAGKNRRKKSNSIWICLECGCFLCGGVGLPTSTQNHAIKHTRFTNHPLVIQFQNPNLRWCFTCNIVVKISKSKENGGVNDTLSDVVKFIKKRSVGEQCIISQDALFISGSNGGESKVENDDVSFDYVVRGLINLGNTCFFNSILQNLLSIGILRNYFTNVDGSLGSLTVAMKKLFSETGTQKGHGKAMNPKSVFGSLCSKVPRFRGCQQHDSHELLQCLLDELCTEEMNMNRQKRCKKNEEGQTIVDDIFKGQTLSTVCCMECGHSSTVVEPFLDISLSVPNRDHTVHVSNSKKATTLTKKGKRRNRAKFCNSNSDSTKIGTNATSRDGKYSSRMDEAAKNSNNEKPYSSDGANMAQKNSKNITTEASSCTLTDQAKIGTESVANEKLGLSDADDLTWLEYTDLRLENDNVLAVQDSESMVSKGVEFSSECDEVADLSQKLKSGLCLDNSSNDCIPVTDVVQSDTLCSTNNSKEDILDLDGLSELFNDDATEVPVNRTVINEIQPANCSGSDYDELSDADSTVSLENCLAYFTKPEILSDEHAWNCENCLKLLKERKCNLVSDSTKVVSKCCISDGRCSRQKNGHVDSDKHSHESAACNGTINNFIEFRHDRMIRTDPNIHSSEESVQDESSEVSRSSYDRCGQNNDNIRNSCEPSCSIEWQIGENMSKDSDSSGVIGESKENGHDVINSESGELKKDAMKRILIKKAPSVLTIHLKRFRQDACGRLNKLKGHINFGDKINLLPYMDTRSDKDGYEYHLTGVVEHSGTMRGGHYVAYVKGKEEKKGGEMVWHHVSDTYVRKASLTEVLSSEAYILFYQKHHLSH